MMVYGAICKGKLKIEGKKKLIEEEKLNPAMTIDHVPGHSITGKIDFYFKLRPPANTSQR